MQLSGLGIAVYTAGYFLEDRQASWIIVVDV
jgi:hypothetical protein